MAQNDACLAKSLSSLCGSSPPKTVAVTNPVLGSVGDKHCGSTLPDSRSASLSWPTQTDPANNSTAVQCQHQARYRVPPDCRYSKIRCLSPLLMHSRQAAAGSQCVLLGASTNPSSPDSAPGLATCRAAQGPGGTHAGLQAEQMHTGHQAMSVR